MAYLIPYFMFEQGSCLRAGLLSSIFQGMPLHLLGLTRVRYKLKIPTIRKPNPASFPKDYPRGEVLFDLLVACSVISQHIFSCAFSHITFSPYNSGNNSIAYTPCQSEANGSRSAHFPLSFHVDSNASTNSARDGRHNIVYQRRG